MIVAIAALHENGRIGETLGIDLTANVVQVNAFADMPTRVLDGAVAIHVAQLAQTEAIRIVGWICEAINDD